MLNFYRLKTNSKIFTLNNYCSFILFAAAALLLVLTSCSNQDNTNNGPDSETTDPGLEVFEEKAKSEASDGPEIDEEDDYPYQAAENAQADPETVPRVALYNGSGSWADNVDTLKDFFVSYEIDYGLVDEYNIIYPELLNDYEIVILPGGGAADYRYEISDHDNIRSFVKDGGLFIGFCAGAYYAADIFIWQGSEYDYPLEIFSGSSIGPLSGQVGWGEQALLNLNPDHPANESFEHELDIYYFDGPYFIPHDNEEFYAGTIEILARYDVNDQPAVIAGRYGEGSYLLFGPHPEMDGYGKDEGANWPWLYSSLLWFANW